MKTSSRFFFTLCLMMGFMSSALALPTKLGDLDDDGVFTANDLAKLVAHSAGTAALADTLAPFADLNQDGSINSEDQEELVKLILESATPRDLPLATVRQTSPYSDEGDVAVTRETVVHFSMPLALSSALDTNQFYADSGGRKMLSRVEISSDRKKATLFYLEPLPSNARVRVVLAPTGLNDLLGRGVDLDENGTQGGNLIFFFETLSITGLPGTAISGQVLASEQGPGGVDVPISGATITVDGAEETLRTTTDAQGNFVLNPCPGGSFFVHVDGRTSPASSYPNGNYYPSVGKRWDAVAGSTANLSGNVEDTTRGKIYLPLIIAGSLNAVSATEETPVEFPQDVLDDHPELEGTRLDVPPNSLFADDGTRGGKLGIAPVDSDRLPSPLPPGLELPMVITIQTDGGTNFDQPVPICFPNLPDPVTGIKLPPGAKSALWSFNHDKGNWEIVGPMTVTDDGEFVKTDEGVGIRQPGWHGTQQGSGGGGGPPRRRRQPPPDDPPCEKRGAWDWANLVYDIGKETASCAIEFAKAKQALKCVFTLVDLTKSLLVGAANIGEKLGSGENLEALEQLLGIIEADLADTEALLGCVEAGTPFSRAAAAFECMGNALNIADGICQFNDDPSAPAKCQSGYGAKKFCQGIQQARVLHSEIKIFVDFLKGAGEQAILASATAVVKQIKLLLETIRRKRAEAAGAGGAPPPPPSSIQLTPEEREQLRLRLQDLEKELIKLRDFAGGASKLVGAMDNFQKQADGMVSAAGEDLNDFGEPVKRSSYYKFTVDTIVRRGRTPNSGTLSLIMAPDSRYDLEMYDAQSREFGSTQGATGPNGSNFDLNAVAFIGTQGMTDGDNDGLVDRAESIVGTNPADEDTDNDGIKDGAEVEQGSDPLGGLIAQTGIVATVPSTEVIYRDIATANNLAVTANTTSGSVTVYNISNALAPSAIATLDLLGQMESVDIDGSLIVVATSANFVIIDASNLADVKVRHTVQISNCKAAAVAGSLAFAGTADGKVRLVDTATGLIMDEILVSNAGATTIHDLAVWRDTLFVLQPGKLTSIDIPTFTTGDSLAVTGTIGAGGRPLRLFAGDDTLYALHTAGFNIVNTSNPLAPTLLSDFTNGQFGWKHIVMNGSGMALAAADPNSTSDGAHDVYLYTVGANGRSPAFGSVFATPGRAAAVSIYNGLAYVADESAGLQVISYLAFDSQGQAPGITVGANFTLDQGTLTGQIESAKRGRISATVTDDVQVKNVEFYLDGTLAQVDGNYPFDFNFVSPNRVVPTKTSFTLRAKATDTGGNSTLSPLYTIDLIPDIIPPVVRRVSPRAIGGNVHAVLGVFSEALDPATCTPANFQLTYAGPNNTFGDSDDAPVTPTRVYFRDDIQAAAFEVPDILIGGKYRGSLNTGLMDLSGNALAAPYSWDFSVDNSNVIWAGLETGVQDWNNPDNWSKGEVPAPGSTVIINGGAGLKINVTGRTLTNVNLVLDGGVSLVSGSNVSGSYTTLNGVTLSGGDLVVGGYDYLSLGGGFTLNGGRIIVGGDAGYSSLSVSGTIGGTGEIILYNTTVYSYYTTATIGPDITIKVRGNANINGSSPTQRITLQGTTIMDTSAAALQLLYVRNEGTVELAKGLLDFYYAVENPGSVALSAAGTLRLYGYNDAQNPMTLATIGTINRTGGTVILSGHLDLGGGVLALNASTGTWQTQAATILNGSITTTGGALLEVASGYYGYLTTLKDIDLQGSVNVIGQGQLTLEGVWQNHGTITLTDNVLNLAGTFKLAEVGNIVRNGTGEVRIAGTVDNAGLTLNLNGLPAGFTLYYTGTIKGGTITGTGSDPIVMPDYATWQFDGVTLDRDLRASVGSYINIKNGLTLNNASIIGESVSNYTSCTLSFYGVQTLGGTGSIDFNRPASTLESNLNIYVSGLNVPPYGPGHLTISPNVTIKLGDNGQIYTDYTSPLTAQGSIQMSQTGGTYNITGRFENEGTVAVSAGTLNITNQEPEYPWINTGTFDVSGAGVLGLGGTFTLAQLGTLNRTGGTVSLIGTLDLGTTGTLALNATTGSWQMGGANYSPGSIKGGTVTTTGGATLIVPALNHYGSLDGTNLQGTVTVTEGYFELKGDWANNGVINQAAGTINVGGEFLFSDLGTINSTGGKLLIVGTLLNTGGTFALDNARGLKFGYNGTIKGGTVTSSAPFTTEANLTFTLDGVTIAGQLKAPACNIYSANGLTIASGARLTLESSYLTAIGEQTFNGPGEIVCEGDAYYPCYINTQHPYGGPYTGFALTFGPTLTFISHSNAYIRPYYYGNSIINNGIIRADTDQRSIIITNPFTNNGQLQQLNGGVITIQN